MTNHIAFVQQADALTRSERQDLERLESTVSEGISSYRKTGEALAEIRQKKLYRTSHRSFDAYLRERWDLSRQYASKLISAAGMAAELSTQVDVLVPTSERQLRAMSGIGCEFVRAAVWGRAVSMACGGQPTPAQVAEARLEEEDEARLMAKDGADVLDAFLRIAVKAKDPAAFADWVRATYGEHADDALFMGRLALGVLRRGRNFFESASNDEITDWAMQAIELPFAPISA